MKFPLSRSKNIVVHETGDELLIYDLATNKAICLNETSAFIWRSCDGRRSSKEIADALSLEHSQPVEESFVWLALEQLKKENLVEGHIPAMHEGLTRREVIRRVGLGSMIALPVIGSLMAPTPAMAASGCSAPGTSIGSLTSTDSCSTATPADLTSSCQFYYDVVPSFQLCCSMMVVYGGTCMNDSFGQAGFNCTCV